MAPSLLRPRCLDRYMLLAVCVQSYFRCLFHHFLAQSMVWCWSYHADVWIMCWNLWLQANGRQGKVSGRRSPFRLVVFYHDLPSLHVLLSLSSFWQCFFLFFIVILLPARWKSLASFDDLCNRSQMLARDLLCRFRVRLCEAPGSAFVVPLVLVAGIFPSSLITAVVLVHTDSGEVLAIRYEAHRIKVFTGLHISNFKY